MPSALTPGRFFYGDLNSPIALSFESLELKWTIVLSFVPIISISPQGILFGFLISKSASIFVPWIFNSGLGIFIPASNFGPWISIPVSNLGPKIFKSAPNEGPWISTSGNLGASIFCPWISISSPNLGQYISIPIPGISFFDFLISIPESILGPSMSTPSKFLSWIFKSDPIVGLWISFHQFLAQ